MTEYETLVVLKPDLTEEAVGEISNRLGGIIKKGNGMVLEINNLGKKSLAYKVARQPKGNYVQFLFRGGGNLVSELERNLRITEEIIRFVTMRKDKVGISNKKREVKP